MTRYRSIAVMLPLLLLVAAMTGCTGMRFVVDLIPAENELDETMVLKDGGPGTRPNHKVALIDVNGLLADADRSSVLGDGENPVASLAESLERARQDNRVRAVVIRLNSPGGTVTASDVMYREVQAFRAETGKPVVMLMGDVAASGAMYLACAGDSIIAHPTSITGSIGVIMQLFDVSDGMRRLGISSNAITSGPNKDMGSPFDTMEDSHRALFQDMVDEFYGSFRTIVTDNRPDLAESDLGWVTDGRVVTGRRAAEIGLVDKTGDLRDAFAEAKTLAGIDAARLMKYHRTLDYVGSAYASAPVPLQINMINVDVSGVTARQPGFLYVWDPSVW
ncbi:MAG: signal peptide peptidase SppA [Planctomycetota bacterium]